jgi:hypothetical protein
MRNSATLANMAIDEAWAIVDARPRELTDDERRVRDNLLRKFREGRPPFSPDAVRALDERALKRFIENGLTKSEAMSDG